MKITNRMNEFSDVESGKMVKLRRNKYFKKEIRYFSKFPLSF
jgi:hypothetical protein